MDNNLVRVTDRQLGMAEDKRWRKETEGKCGCVIERLRDRETEREEERMCVCVCVCVSARVCKKRPIRTDATLSKTPVSGAQTG